MRSQLNKIARHVDDGRLGDLNLNSVGRYLQDLRQAGRSARTVNQHRATAVAFANWCVERGRLESISLTRLPKLDESLDRRRKRRAATEDELRRLFTTLPDERRPHYLTELLTGLRRK